MWFNPSELLSEKITPPANFANYTPDIGETKATISRISSPFASEKQYPNNSGLAALAGLAAPYNKKSVNCGQCLHFKSYNLHGKGSGICTNSGDYGSWSETQHQCTKFNQNKPPANPANSANLTVICYTPNGKAIEVEARDEEHAAWLRKMNPAR